MKSCAPTNLRHRDDAAGILVDHAHGDVVEHRSGEELHVLRHAADLGAQLRRRQVRDVGAVDQHAAGGRLEQALDQIGDRRLARARGPTMPMISPAADREIGVAQDAGAVVVGAIGHALERDLAR